MKKSLTTGGIVRLVIYILGALTGLAALVLPLFGFTAAGALLGTLAALFAAITGGTATYNLPKAPDQSNVDVAAILPALMALVNEVKNYRPDTPEPEAPVSVEVPESAPQSTLETLRDMLANRA